MKKILIVVTGFVMATMCLSPLGSRAGFVSPNGSPLASETPLGSSQPPALVPSGLSATWTVTSVADDGPGSLRQAIANAAAGDTIDFALPCSGTIVLSNTLVIDKDLNVQGPGPARLTVMRSDATNTPSFRVFQIDAGVVTLAGMTIRNGRAVSGAGFLDNLGGGILNSGALTVDQCVIAGNTAPEESGRRGFGGGIFTLGPLTMLDSTVCGNVASAAGGGICTFHSPRVLMERCTVNGNWAGIQGGGVNFQGLVGTLQNSTISGNAVEETGAASGVLNVGFGNESSTLTLAACTITRNSGTTNGSVIFAALAANRGVTNRLVNTLVAENQSPGFFLDGNPVLESLGHNLDGDGTSGLANGINGDIVGSADSPINPRLSPLAKHGGPTWTHALLPGSPALDAGACLGAESMPLTTDQRSQPRPQGIACDIGAFENQPPTVTCPPELKLECVLYCRAVACLTATVADPDGDPLAVVWFVDGAPYRTNYVSLNRPEESKKVTLYGALDVGTHPISVWVSDGKAAPVGCSTSVTVQDTKPPKILTISAHPDALWPADARLVPVKVRVTALDACGPIRSRIISVSSNEPAGGAEPDWIITGDLALQLRAESFSRTPGRVYTITVECRDASDNASMAKVRVRVCGPTRPGNLSPANPEGPLLSSGSRTDAE